uniref:Uncharacterized protein n=1 Tax=Anopheles darlingi TaxID=43151 RepID=A0A2M4D5V1_ANODA
MWYTFSRFSAFLLLRVRGFSQFRSFSYVPFGFPVSCGACLMFLGHAQCVYVLHSFSPSLLLRPVYSNCLTTTKILALFFHSFLRNFIFPVPISSHGVKRNNR